MIDESYQKGAEDMRERCALECVKQIGGRPSNGETRALWKMAKAIRALKANPRSPDAPSSSGSPTSDSSK